MIVAQSGSSLRPLLSIIIPVYNVAPYLADCLHSILPQLSSNIEVLLLDDASTDESADILRDIHHCYPHLKVFYQKENRGVSVVRNTLKQYAQGEYIWFIDSDDIVRPNVCQMVLDAIKNFHGVDVIIGDYYLWEPAKNDEMRLEKTFLGKIHQQFENSKTQFLFNLNKLRKNYIWCHIYKYDLVQQVDFQLRARFEDIFFITELSLKCHSYVYLAEPFINYRSRPNSSTTSKKCRSYLNDFLTAFIDRHEKIQSINMPISKKAYMYYKLYNNYVSALKNIKNDKTLKHDEKMELMKYIQANFQSSYEEIYHDCKYNIDFIRKMLLQKKHRQAIVYYSKYLDAVQS